MAEEFTAKFKVDITDLKKNISDATKSIREANATFKAQTAGMDKWSDNADGLSHKLDQLDTILKNQKTILASYRDQLKKQREAYEENGKRADELRKKLAELTEKGVSKSSEEYQKYKKALQNVTKEQENNEKAADDLKIVILNQEAAVKSTEREIRHYKTSLDNLDSATEEVTKDTGEANEGFTILKGTLANLAAEGIKKAISGLKKLGQAAVDAYKDFDTGSDNIIKATGATGEAAEKLQKTYKNVTQKVVGDLGEIGSTLGEVNTRFGFTDDKLEDATEAFTKFAKVTGTDATTAVRSVSRIMEKAGIPAENYGELLDALAVAAQASGASVDDLTGILDKVGTEMDGLGFDTKETVALLSSFEKSGVNTNNALAGMRKAFQKWAKEGKNSKKEFQKVIEEIKSTPNKTKAAQKAIEVFGTKAGTELANAIKDGKFEYSEFLKTLEGSAGTVEKTYEATQDGFDKVKLVIQGAKSEIGAYVSDLAKKYAPQIEEFAKKAVEGFKKVVSWVTENGKTLATFAGAVAAAFGVKKIVDFVSAIGKTVGALKGVVGAVKGVSGAFGSLDFAALLNPIGLVVAAVGGLSAVFVLAKENIEKEMEAQYGLTEEQKKTVQAAADIKTSYGDMDTARKNSMAAIDSEFGYIKELKEEYNKLIDKNGKVKKGYEDRANFILNQLAQSLGVERSEIDKVIGKNGELGASIDEIIRKKQAEATLSANETAYTDAIQKRNEALSAYQSSLTTLDEAEGNYKKTLAETRAEREKISTAMRNASGSVDQYQYQLSQLDNKEKIAKKAMEDARQAVEDSETAYVGYINTISNYEGLSASILSGDAKAIDDSMTAITNSLITAKNGTEATLKKQKENAEKTYNEIKQAAAKGTAGVTQETVRQAKEMLDKSTAELNKFEGVYKKSFRNVVTEAESIQKPLGTIATGAATSFYSSLGSADNQAKTKAASGSLVNAAVSEASTAQGKMKTEGGNAGGGFIAGLASKIGDGIQAAANFVTNIINSARATQKSASPSKVWRDEVGESAGEGYVVGLAKTIPAAVKTAKTLVSKAIDAAAGEAPKISAGRSFGSYGRNIAGNITNAVTGLNSGATGGFSGGSNVTNVGGANYTYNQTINSPTPLSRIEIYRQTKNLLTLAKMGA